jgi:hypothetical protein
MVTTHEIPIGESRTPKGDWLRVSGMGLMKLGMVILGKFLPGSIHRPLPSLPHKLSASDAESLKSLIIAYPPFS